VFGSLSLVAAGTYTMFARSELVGDGVPANDEIAGTFDVSGPLAGIYPVGSAQAAPFNTLTDAVGHLNLVGVSAPVIFELTDPSYSGSETFPITIHPILGGGPSRTFTLRPAGGVTASVSGASATALLVIDGADYVTIDGSNNGTSSRDLTLTNTSASPSSAVIWGQVAGGTDGASHDVVKNVVVEGSGTTQTLAGIGFGGATIGATSDGFDHDGNRIENCRVSKVRYGIYSSGAGAANKNLGTVIAGNLVGTTASDVGMTAGIFVRFEDGVQIVGNQAGDVSLATGARFGVSLGVAPAGDPLVVTGGDEVANATVARNRVAAVDGPSATGVAVVGITVGPAGSGTTVLANNMVSCAASPVALDAATIGVHLIAGTGSTQLYFNSVSLSGDRGTATSPGFALAVLGTDPTLELVGNALSNSQTSTGTVKNYAIGLSYSSYANLLSDSNDLYVAGAGSALGTVGGLGAGIDQPDLLAWRATTGGDAASISADGLFGPNDLHVLGTGPVSPLSNAALPVAGILDDFDGQPRGATPDIGADEFTTHTLNVTIAGSGAVTRAPDQASYYPGSVVSLTAVPADTCQEFVGWSGDATGNANPLGVTIDADRNITATFALETYTVTATAGTGGTITPPGVTNVGCGADQAFAITPGAGFAVADVQVDSVSVGAVTDYTFTHVAANHTIAATFADEAAPLVQVTSPNGGETLIIGVPVTVQWSASDNVGVTCVDLLLSRNGLAGPFDPIATCVANTGSYQWLVDGAETVAALLRVVGHDAAANSGADDSDLPFTIMEQVVAVTEFQASAVDGGVQLGWVLSQGGAIAAVEVERGDAREGPYLALQVEVVREGDRMIAMDRSVTPGQTYFYRLSGRTSGGQVIPTAPIRVTAGVPITAFELASVWPNPAGPSTNLAFAVPRSADVTIGVFDAMGREVARLADQRFEPGRYRLTWSGRTSTGPAPSGVYFVRLQVQGVDLSKRFVLQR
jgi:hypothetical protein